MTGQTQFFATFLPCRGILLAALSTIVFFFFFLPIYLTFFSFFIICVKNGEEREGVNIVVLCQLGGPHRFATRPVVLNIRSSVDPSTVFFYAQHFMNEFW